MGTGALNCCDITNSRSNDVAYSLNTYPMFYGIYGQEDLDVRVKFFENLTAGKTLMIKVVNNGSLPKGKIFTILPRGYEGSSRFPKDGCTYFGSKRENEVCDIDIYPEEAILEDSQKGRNFIIYYKIEKNSYWIKDLGRGHGVFVKIDSSLVVFN